MRGTRRDGSPHLMRGVILFGIEHGEIVCARFYLEPVEVSDTISIDQAVPAQLGTAHLTFNRRATPIELTVTILVAGAPGRSAARSSSICWPDSSPSAF